MSQKYTIAQENHVPTKWRLSEFTSVGWSIRQNFDVTEHQRQEYVRLAGALLDGNTIIFAQEEESPF